MKRINKKRTYKLTSAGKLVVGLTVLIVISITTQLYVKSGNAAMETELIHIYDQIGKVRYEIYELRDEVRELTEQMILAKYSTLNYMGEESLETNIIVTNYWDGDGSSGAITASGLTTLHFDTNDDGMYTYNDKVVVATANVDRLARPLFEGYNTHNLYDELELTFNDKTYEAIVLDVCGSCYGVTSEGYQRYDVFTVGNVIGKKEGVLHE